MVYKVRRESDGQEYALKKVRMGNLSSKEKENSLNEVRILASFEYDNASFYAADRHPSIVSYKEAFFEDSTSSLCIVMEYADGGDLYAHIVEHTKKNSHFPEEQIWSMFVQTVRGLKALHDHNILHRDLKALPSRMQLSRVVRKCVHDERRTGEAGRPQRVEGREERPALHPDWHPILCQS